MYRQTVASENRDDITLTKVSESSPSSTSNAGVSAAGSQSKVTNDSLHTVVIDLLVV